MKINSVKMMFPFCDIISKVSMETATKTHEDTKDTPNKDNETKVNVKKNELIVITGLSALIK